jgi:hypothetical protein
MSELGYTLLAILLTLGALSALVIASSSDGFFSKLVQEVRLELPRTMYLFGSSITGTTLALSCLVALHASSSVKPAAGYAGMALIFALAFFGFGFGLKAWLSLNPVRNIVRK